MRLCMARTVPYCGEAPSPDTLWSHWNLDPLLISILVSALFLYAVGAADSHSGLSAQRRLAFIAGWATASAALLSPLCPLSVALFSARVAQHMVLALVSAPLIVLGEPGKAYSYLLPNFDLRSYSRSLTSLLRGGVTPAILFTFTLWFWHSPQPYEATFESSTVYWLMH